MLSALRYTCEVRVVAGEARGRRLVAPDGPATRPTGDRVREAVFNALHSLDAVVGRRYLDLFAGSGALGIEALSRGADHCTFVDSSPAALRAIRANLDATGLAARAAVRQADAAAFLAGSREHFDVALLDPPYAFDGWADLLTRLPADLVVVESGHEIELPAGWDAPRTRRYGGTVVHFARRAAREHADDE
jgi:16S rRNA (guanine966-N2)-methyltransferase